MDKEQLQRMIDGVGALAEIMALTYKTMIKAGLDTGEAVVLSQSLIEVIIGQNNG